VAHSQSKEVNLTKRVKTSNGMRYCPVVLSGNGRVKPDFVIVNGQPERTLRAPATWNGERAAGACAWQTNLAINDSLVECGLMGRKSDWCLSESEGSRKSGTPLAHGIG
jgi:hypothetical protein